MKPVSPDTGLIDIVAPVAPATSHWTGLGLLALLAVVLVLVLFGLRTHRLRARRRLARLRRDLIAGHAEPRQAIYAVAAELRDNGLRPLERTPARAHGAEHAERWQRFTVLLSLYRYGPTAPSMEQALGVIREARRWLRPWI